MMPISATGALLGSLIAKTGMIRDSLLAESRDLIRARENQVAIGPIGSKLVLYSAKAVRPEVGRMGRHPGSIYLNVSHFILSSLPDGPKHKTPVRVSTKFEIHWSGHSTIRNMTATANQNKVKPWWRQQEVLSASNKVC